MIPPALPADEAERLQELRRYDILDTPPEQVFDDLTALASHICATPIALVSLVDADRQWFKSKVGLDATQTSRDVSFCGHVVHDREALVVVDALEDPRFADNPLVTGCPNVRFYAGAPLESPSGRILGTLCVIDRVPRHLTATQREMLQALSRQVVSQLELRRVNRLALQTTRELEAARRAAEAANTAKSAFLANMSHELRTPLNSVIGFTTILSRNEAGSLTPRDLDLLGRIGANGRHLLSLLNDILDLSKIEAGRMELVHESCTLPSILSEVVDATEGDARARGVTLTWACDATTPIVADRRRLVQVLINLVGNGLKFARGGHVHVSVLEADGVPCRIDVSDDGVGIPEDKRTAIFGAFQQADIGTARHFGGSGLGLAISRALCRNMGFDLDVASEEGHGATFSVRLRPDAPPVVHTPPGPPPARPMVSPVPRTILVIGDDAQTRRLLRQRIEALGHRVVAVDSPERGAGLAAALHPDAVVVGRDAPGKPPLSETLRQQPALADLPLVACRAVPHADDDDLEARLARLWPPPTGGPP